MSKWHVIGGALALIIIAVVAFAVWMAGLPVAVAAMTPPPVPREETEAMLATLRPRHERPLVAVVMLNEGTETTDALMPTGILRRANVADVMMLAMHPGPVNMFPALKVEADATLSHFDAAHPEGADYVIVPAMIRDDDPAISAWIRDQSRKGAIIIGICAGAKVVAATGLLDGMRATTHWFFVRQMLTRSPTIRYVPDRRMVLGNRIVTTTGISASMPMMLTLIEAIGGRDKAESVARDLGVSTWGPQHASKAFALTRPFSLTVMENRLAFWNREGLGIQLAPGMDEVSLALVADAWSRTYRSHVTTFADQPQPITTRQGIRIIPDQSGADWPGTARVLNFPAEKPAAALDRTLDQITTRYGSRTTDVVAMQLEYPRPTAR